MPRRSPFTALCQAAARLQQPRADLHMHTTASDGDFTPSQVVAQARNASLGAIAITDHDTTAGIAEAQTTLFSTRPVEVLVGVEISTTFQGQGYHLLGYSFDISHPGLQQMLASIRERRRERFQSYIDAFGTDGLAIQDHLLSAYASESIAVGRRHLAKLLVASGHANTLQLAFLMHIHPRRGVGSHNVPMEQAIDRLHQAGGIGSLAHPPKEMELSTLVAMRAIGLDAVEHNAPSIGYERSEELKEWAKKLGMIVTAGSDYHGEGHTLGSRTLGMDQLAVFRGPAGSDARTEL